MALTARIIGESKADEKRHFDHPCQRSYQFVAGMAQHRLVESKIRAGEPFAIIGDSFHLLKQSAQLGNLRWSCPSRAQGGGGGFDCASQVEYRCDVIARGRCVTPGKQVRVQMVPLRAGADACAGLRPRFNHPLAREHLDSFSEDTAPDAEPSTEFICAGQEISGPEFT